MAQVEPVYDEIPEFADIADKLISKYPSEFGNIDVAKIACVGITNKTRGEKKKQIWDIRPIRPPVSMFCPKEYIVVFFQHDWDSLGDVHRSLIVADVLCSIPPDGKGTIQPSPLRRCRECSAPQVHDRASARPARRGHPIRRWR